MTARRVKAVSIPFAIGAIALAIVVVRPVLLLDTWRVAERWRHGGRAGSVEVAGRRLGFVEVGQDGPPVLLVHGLRGESAALLAFARALADRGLHVVAIDLPGHGRSPEAAAPLDIGGAARLVLEAADGVGLGPRPVLVGHSLGGWIVLWAALEQPGRCRAVVPIAAPGLPFDPPPLPELISQTVSDARRSLPDLFARPPWIPAPLLWVAIRRPAASSAALLASAFSGRFLLDGLLEGVAVPAVVVFGAQDRLVPPEVGRSMAEAMGVPFVTVPGAGHMVVWEQPERTADVVRRALEGAALETGG